LSSRQPVGAAAEPETGGVIKTVAIENVVQALKVQARQQYAMRYWTRY